MPDLNSLVVFAHVIEANSFSGAARILKMPISTVSRRIAELEDQLGVRLIERSTRRLRLTDAGSEVLEHARRTVELSDAVDNVASNLLSHVSGTLRLASPPSISDTMLAPIVGAFQSSYPNVRVQIFITDRIVDHVSEGVDLTFRVGDLEDSSLVARRILKGCATSCSPRALLETEMNSKRCAAGIPRRSSKPSRNGRRCQIARVTIPRPFSGMVMSLSRSRPSLRAISEIVTCSTSSTHLMKPAHLFVGKLPLPKQMRCLTSRGFSKSLDCCNT